MMRNHGQTKVRFYWFIAENEKVGTVFVNGKNVCWQSSCHSNHHSSCFNAPKKNFRLKFTQMHPSRDCFQLTNTHSGPSSYNNWKARTVGKIDSLRGGKENWRHKMFSERRWRRENLIIFRHSLWKFCVTHWGDFRLTFSAPGEKLSLIAQLHLKAIPFRISIVMSWSFHVSWKVGKCSQKMSPLGRRLTPEKAVFARIWAQISCLHRYQNIYSNV